MESIRGKLIEPCRHHDYIINMDQIPIPFICNSNKMLKIIGRRIINARKSINDTKRATFAITICASGRVLKTLIVFKGKPGGGGIEQHEFSSCLVEVVYTCQHNAWIDERVMIMWVHTIFKPCVL